MAKKPVPAQAVAVREPEVMPAYLANYTGPTGLEGFTREDFKVPRIKLLQALSPEIKDHPDECFPGQFWVTSTKENIDEEFEFIIALAQRRVTLWAPRSAGGGMLARANDGVHWDKPNQDFTVDIKGVGKFTYNTKDTVQASGLLDWGSSNPNNSDSAPAATLSYDYLVYMLPDGRFSPIVFSLYRTGVDTARDLLSMLAATRRPIQSIKLIARSVETTKGSDTFSKWQFQLNGVATDEQFNAARKLAVDYADFEAEEEKPENAAGATQDFAKYQAI